MTFEAVALDEKLPSPYLDKYEPTKGRTDYLFICSPKKWRTEIHFSEALKTSFHCFGGSCCKVIPQKTPYTIYLVAQYNNGRNEKSDLVLKFIRAGRQVDDAIRSLAEQYEDPKELTKLDLKVELDTSKAEKYKMPKITPCLDGKRRAGAEALADLKEQIKSFMPNLQASVANIMTEEQFRDLCAQNDIDIEDFVAEDAPDTKSKKVTKVENIEEPVEIEEVESTSEDTMDDTKEIAFDDPEEVEETEEEPKKASKKAPKKVDKEEIPSENFDIDDLLN